MTEQLTLSLSYILLILLITLRDRQTDTDIDTYEGLTGAIMKAEKALKLQ